MPTRPDPARAAARAEALREELREHAHRYYVLDAPAIADADYDALFQELQAIEASRAEFNKHKAEASQKTSYGLSYSPQYLRQSRDQK